MLNSSESVSLKWRVWFGIVVLIAIFGNIASQNLHPRIIELQDSVEQLEGKVGQLEFNLKEQKSLLEEMRRDLQPASPAPQ